MPIRQARGRRGISAILGVGCLWGTIGVFIGTLSERSLSLVDVALFRSFFACLLFGFCLPIFPRAALRAHHAAQGDCHATPQSTVLKKENIYE